MERLTMNNIQANVVTFKPSEKRNDYQTYHVSTADVTESNAITYLFECHRRARLLLQEFSVHTYIRYIYICRYLYHANAVLN